MDGAFPSQKGQSFDNIPGGNGYGRGNGGGSGGGGQRRGFRGTAENAKTKLCTRWLQGDCRFGDRCNFAHGEHELRKLPARDENGAAGGPPPAGGRFGGGRGRGGYGYGGRGGGGPPGGAGYRGQGGRGPQGGYDEYYQGGPPGGYGGGYPGGQPNYQGGYGMEHPQQGTGGYGPVGGQQADPSGGQRGPGQNMQQEEVWAQQGYPVQGPNGWFMYRTKDTGEAYYHNHRSNVTQWERPADWPMSAPHM